MIRIARPVAVGVSPQAVPVASCRKDPGARRTTPPSTFLGSLPRLPLILLACLFPLDPACGTDEHDLPRNIRVIVEYIEAPHALATEAVQSKDADSGPKLHARMRGLVGEKKARIMETSILTTRSGRRAIVESIMEHISPTESEYASIPHSVPSTLTKDPPEFPKIPRLRPDCPTAFETRNVGVTLEIEPVVARNGRVIDLRLAPEIVNLLRYETVIEHHDQWGDGSVRRPIYETLRFSTSVAVEDGKFGFVGFLTPDDEKAGRDTKSKIMLFIRADIAPISP